MGTADYCVLVVLLLAGLVALSIRQEEKRCVDRRHRLEPPPGGMDRRSGRDRRARSLKAWATWAADSQWRKVRKRF